ncbi:Aldo/keto reductase [Rickenella mellea]|uniref:Aldo/keto reductase n=1 Tax=Rickenella mellea TaxID=50990 RepID=A0A4Y7PNP3_9AGAM|nr:Aldo/keto reductase [Rickenella mellea]
MSSTTTPLVTFHDGHTAPRLSFGTGTALYGKHASTAVTLAISSGFTHIDGAQAYGNESSMAEGIRAAAASVPRSSLYVTTKLGRFPQDGVDGVNVEASLRKSLERLGMEHVDLFLVHASSDHVGRDLKDIWNQMVAVKKLGLTKSIGVSNFNVKDLKTILADGAEVPVVNQIEFHPFLTKTLAPLLAFQAQHNILTESYGTLTPIHPRRPIPEDSDAALLAARDKLLELLDAAGKGRGENVSRNAILLKWVWQRGFLTVTTSSKEERLRESVAALDLPDLSAEEMSAIDAIGNAHFRSFRSYKHMDDA